MKRLFLVLLILSSANDNVFGQSFLSSDKWKEYILDMKENIEDEESVEILYTELSYLSEHPMELNNLTGEQLRRLPFLSDKQINGLLDYRERYGKWVSLYELKNVPTMDFSTIELLLPFVYVGETVVDKRPMTVDNLFKRGRNELIIRYSQCFQQKEGYKDFPDSILALYPNRRYIGEAFYNSVRYSYTFDDRIQFGLTGEKDAGEPFRKGYDYYSAHLLIKDMKWLKTLVVGDYRMSFGQGLVVSNDFTLSENVMVTQTEKRNNGFRRHYSTNENNYFRGLGATLSFGQVDISLFYSDKKVDGTVSGDTVVSLKTDGLHRLPREIDKKHTLSMQTMGGNVRYAAPNFLVGITTLHYSFGGLSLQPELHPYNLYYFRGKNNTNIGVDYKLQIKNVRLYGETATSANRSIATLNALRFEPASYVSFLLLYRNYSKRYQAYYGNAFSRNSTIQNEQGVYLGLQFVPVAHWKLSANIDVFRFPWLKYTVDAPSSGVKYQIRTDYDTRRGTSFYLRYRYAQAEENETLTGSRQVITRKIHRVRWQLNYGSKTLRFTSSLDGVLNEKEAVSLTNGWMAAQGMNYVPSDPSFFLFLYAAYFDTDNSSCTVYSYEKNPSYVFNMPSFYGKGLRLAAVLRHEPVDKWMIAANIGATRYFDRNSIGTGTEQIKGNLRMDANLILRGKF